MHATHYSEKHVRGVIGVGRVSMLCMWGSCLKAALRDDYTV